MCIWEMGGDLYRRRAGPVTGCLDDSQSGEIHKLLTHFGSKYKCQNGSFYSAPLIV